MKQIINNISRITLALKGEGRGVGLLLILLMMAMSPMKMWADGVSYLKPTYNTAGDPKTGVASWSKETATNPTQVTSSTDAVTWGTAGQESWYYVTGNVTLTKGAVCVGNVHLILCDGAKLTVTNSNYNSAGIHVSGDDNSFTIYAQSTGASMGALSATGTDVEEGGGGGGGAGIGGDGGVGGTRNEHDIIPSCMGQNITINGGKISATAGGQAACIGGGVAGGINGLYINGGIVTASHPYYLNAIGKGPGQSNNDYNLKDVYVNTDLIILVGDEPNPTTPSLFTNTGGDLAKTIFGYAYTFIHQHQLTHHTATDATCTTAGNNEYWDCSGCGKCYSDEAGETETTLADVVIPATGHNYVNGKCVNGCGEMPASMTASSFVDGIAYERTTPATVTNLTYTRTFTGTNWTTWYVPFELTLTDDICKKYEFSRINNVRQYDDNNDGKADRTVVESFRMKSGKTLKANYPYLVRARYDASKEMTLNLQNVTLAEAEENSIDCQSLDYKYTFTGTYAGMDYGNVASTEYTLCDNTANNWERYHALNAQRCYMTVTTLNGASALTGRIELNVLGEDNYVIPGDLNADGNITIADLTQLIQLLNQGGTITNKAADVNKDGSVTVDDVEKLRDKVLGVDRTRGTATKNISGVEVEAEWVQLWENGPKWATMDFGATATNYANASATEYNSQSSPYIYRNMVTNGSRFGNWIYPSVAQYNLLLNKTEDGTSDLVSPLTVWEWCDGSTKQYEEGCALPGYKVSGVGEYSGNSIFFPAAGYYYAYMSSRYTTDGGTKGYYLTQETGTKNFYTYKYENVKMMCFDKAQQSIQTLEVQYSGGAGYLYSSRCVLDE